MRYNLPALAIVFFCSCTNHSTSELAVYRSADEGFKQSIAAISASSNTIYKAFQDRLNNPSDSERTEMWYPKAMLVKALSDSMVIFIEAVKADIQNEAPAKDGKGSFDENDLAVTEHVLISHNRGKELFDKLVKYRNDILAVDPELKQEFHANLVLFASGFDYTKNDAGVFTKTFFHKIPAMATMAMLGKLEHNVKVIENNLVSFCLNRTYSIHCGIRERFWPLVSQSSNYLKAGDELEITAGIGSFNYQSRPQVFINGKIISLTDNPIAVYRLKTPGKAGKYTLPVKIEYTKPDGTKDVIIKNIEYTVIEPNQNP